MKYVIISPHYDDEVLGCGGFLSKKNGSRHIIYMTDTCEIRRAENVKALSYVNVFGKTRVSDLNFADGYLYNQDLPKLSSTLSKTIMQYHEYDTLTKTVFIPSKTLHQDHEVTNRVSLIALRGLKVNVLEYEYPEAGLNFCHFIPNYYVPLSKGQLDNKINAMEAYASQVKSVRDADAIRSLAKQRGYECGEEYAEAFNIIRYYEDERSYL